MIVRRTRREEADQVNRLFAIAFSLPQSSGPAGKEDAPVTSWAAFDGDGTMMSTLSITDYSVRFDGHSCPMAGAGGVATLPQYRRRGGIRACFAACLPELYREGYDFSYLYPFSNAFYRQFGYESCVQKFEASVDLRLLKPRPSGCRFCLCDRDHPYREAIQTVDREFSRDFNMAVIHGHDWYRWTEAPDPAGDLTFTYVVFDRQDRPRACTTFRTVLQEDGRNLQCSRFAFLDPQGFQGLMELFCTMRADHRYAKFQLPADQGLAYLLPEWSMGAMSLQFVGAGMVRVIRARSVLEKAAYRGSGCLTLELKDPEIPENSGCVTVTFRDGRALSVTDALQPPQIRLTMPAFSALITGAGDPKWMDGVEILDPEAPLDSVFYRKKRMITDFF